ncbi:class I SAM-dependent methyltransferase [Ancylobacter amanitiformis]|uniref:SAM-dependent methyltransferase n=1 Tax=Ancylobacter amanitiformis TaxID=217069 RepID=A0ABU0LWI8_9HYPH|nr:class I SAM-dependent methyltransferase [Ancylobacter amanitiformis]MDQ0512970.1 SAM-dependent methyltransferase [Ancylobacter amanitiformis]
MSGFSAEWLALREPVDGASRNPEIAARVGQYFNSRSSLTVVDLGCGTGSNLRALSPSLPQGQRWHLIDGDRDLLAQARQCLADWADRARPSGNGLTLEKDGRRIEVRFECADLTARSLDFGADGADLVTAAALFDLVSREWLERLMAALAGRRVPLYGVLNYDGAARWQPADPLDATVKAAFNRHQRGDKGFGPALGPAAGKTLMQIAARHGYATWSGDSPWRLKKENAPLIAALAAGIASAAGEIEPERGAAFADWAMARAAAKGVTIGHQDVFARA